MYNIMEVAGIQYSDSKFWLFFKKKNYMCTVGENTVTSSTIWYSVLPLFRFMLSPQKFYLPWFLHNQDK